MTVHSKSYEYRKTVASYLKCFIFGRLYKERLSQVDAKLQEVIAGKAPEYLEPLANLQENMQIRTKVAGKPYSFKNDVNITFVRLCSC